MSEIMRIQLKMVFRSAPLLILLLVFQLLLGQIGAAVFKEKEPELKIALMQNSHDLISDTFAETIENSPDIETVIFPAGTDIKKMLESDAIQAAVILTEDFDTRIHKGEDDAILIYPAPGIADISFIEEILSVEIVGLRAEVLLQEALDESGKDLDDYADYYDDTQPLIRIDYEGPEGGSIPLTAPPVFGIPALLLLFAFLHAASALPGPDHRRFSLARPSSRRKSFICCFSSLILAWVLIAGLYVWMMRVIYATQIPIQTIIILLLIPIYAIAFSALFVEFGKRNWTPWVFVFWLALNMTIGGGLWNSVLQITWIRPLVPVYEAVSSNVHGFSSIALLLIEIAVCLIISLAILVFTKNRFTKNIRQDSSQSVTFMG